MIYKRERRGACLPMRWSSFSALDGSSSSSQLLEEKRQHSEKRTLCRRGEEKKEGKDLPLSDIRNVWFQHDDAPLYKVSSVHQYIRDTFQQQVIGYGGCVEWPKRSPDVNPLDFFLWGYIKQQEYATPPPTLQELRNRITDACASVSPAMLYNVQREGQSRVQMCIVAEGHHFEHDR
ncbi:hypothetical protein AVEN_35372-1 [Araneus ventricosus]|uniref:Transposable element Tc3 transposase n=1 Tax=Araneus ventricosus TaxID=182803 RepID=A0A4Y2LZL6_ARAVE|nr:hypothetical protein AVEN_35372-1 [Araneus ventricosus]